MSILSDTAIRKAMAAGEIIIEPYDDAMLGGNSYDVRLGPVLRVYNARAIVQDMCEGGEWIAAALYDPLHGWAKYLDAAVEPSVVNVPIPPDGIVLIPGVLYLGSTIEYTETHRHVAYLDGKSGVGRLGIFVHATAGRGDCGFRGHWTLEISVVQPVRIYAGMPIGQLTYHTVEGEVERMYQTKAGASYLDGRDPMPQASRLWREMRR